MMPSIRDPVIRWKSLDQCNHSKRPLRIGRLTTACTMPYSTYVGLLLVLELFSFNKLLVPIGTGHNTFLLSRLVNAKSREDQTKDRLDRKSVV